MNIEGLMRGALSRNATLMNVTAFSHQPSLAFIVDTAGNQAIDVSLGLLRGRIDLRT
jgi:hypothetical protein